MSSRAMYVLRDAVVKVVSQHANGVFLSEVMTHPTVAVKKKAVGVLYTEHELADLIEKVPFLFKTIAANEDGRIKVFLFDSRNGDWNGLPEGWKDATDSEVSSWDPIIKTTYRRSVRVIGGEASRVILNAWGVDSIDEMLLRPPEDRGLFMDVVGSVIMAVREEKSPASWKEAVVKALEHTEMGDIMLSRVPALRTPEGADSRPSDRYHRLTGLVGEEIAKWVLRAANFHAHSVMDLKKEEREIFDDIAGRVLGSRTVTKAGAKAVIRRVVCDLYKGTAVSRNLDSFKVCGKCGKCKPVEAFYKGRVSKGGASSYCVQCSIIDDKRRRVIKTVKPHTPHKFKTIKEITMSKAIVNPTALELRKQAEALIKQAEQAENIAKSGEVMNEVRAVQLEVAKTVAKVQRMFGEIVDAVDELEKISERFRKAVAAK